jgi:hypothetical protein
MDGGALCNGLYKGSFRAGITQRGIDGVGRLFDPFVDEISKKGNFDRLHNKLKIEILQIPINSGKFK